MLPGLLLAILLAMLDNLIVSTALPRIVGDLGGVAHLSWVVTAYILASTITTPFYGKLGDMYGRKKFFIAAIIIFLVGSALSGLSQIHDGAHRVPRAAGPGGRRADGRRDGDARRHRGAARARPLHELHDGGDDARHHRRPAARRVHHHQLLLALDLLHQHAGGRRGAGLPDRHPARAGQEGQPQGRLPGRRRCSPWPRPRSILLATWGGTEYAGVRRRSSASALLTVAATVGVLRHRDQGRRADAAAARLPEQELLRSRWR